MNKTFQFYFSLHNFVTLDAGRQTEAVAVVLYKTLHVQEVLPHIRELLIICRNGQDFLDIQDGLSSSQYLRLNISH